MTSPASVYLDFFFLIFTNYTINKQPTISQALKNKQKKSFCKPFEATAIKKNGNLKKTHTSAQTISTIRVNEIQTGLESSHFTALSSALSLLV